MATMLWTYSHMNSSPRMDKSMRELRQRGCERNEWGWYMSSSPTGLAAGAAGEALQTFFEPMASDRWVAREPVIATRPN
jgi:hypothetical protein